MKRAARGLDYPVQSIRVERGLTKLPQIALLKKTQIERLSKLLLMQGRWRPL
jgi:hypothetical protein